MDFSSKLLQITNKAGRLCFLNLLYILCCLPVITIGAATAALYTCIFLVLENKDGYLSHAFFSGFRKHFKQGTLLWSGICALCGLFMAALLFARLLPSYFLGPVTAVCILLLVYLYFLSCYLFAFISRFEAELRFVLRSCLILVAKHLFLTIILAMMNAAAVILLILRPSLVLSMLPLIFFLGFSGIAYINGRILIQIFIKEKLINPPDKETPDNGKL